MAPTNRREATSLIDSLFEEPYRFEFFQAVRLLERWAERRGKAAPNALANPTRVDAVRFVVHQYLGFTASPIQDLHQDSERDPPVMSVNFLGLTGPKGVLPKLYTSYLQERADRHGDRATAAFLDLFNHRLISLFHRAWEKHRVATGLEGPAPGTFTRALLALAGLGIPELQGRQTLDDAIPRFHAALFSAQRRTSEGLKAMLIDAFDLPVDIEPLVGHWVAVDPSQRLRLGTSQGSELGSGFVLGARIFDEQSKFRLRIGPLSAGDFRSLLPDRPRFREVTELTRLYVGPEFAFDVELWLKPGEVPRAVAGGDPGESAQLGRFAWFASSDPGHVHGAIFESRV
ncbi:MAG: type VI secretion system baseplate subunit TssG [Isosphaeraceae bacterium]